MADLKKLEAERRKLRKALVANEHNLEARVNAKNRIEAILDNLEQGKPSRAEEKLIAVFKKDAKDLQASIAKTRDARKKEETRARHLRIRIHALRQRSGSGAMFDSIDLSQMPAGARAYAGYVGGNWPTYGELKSRFPGALLLSIAVNASEDADCLDVEAGDATPSQAPAWVKRQHARGLKRPAVYCSISQCAEVLHELESAGIGRHDVEVWTAHYNGIKHRCSPSCGYGMPTTADATQFTDHSQGRNLDESLCSSTIPWHRG